MSKHITRMEIDDAEHFTPEERQAIDSYPEHEREARAKGIPSLGSEPQMLVAGIVLGRRKRLTQAKRDVDKTQGGA